MASLGIHDTEVTEDSVLTRAAPPASGHRDMAHPMMHAPPRRRVGQRVRPIDPALLVWYGRAWSPSASSLIHGFGGDLNNWLFNTDRLAERRRVYALDLPGHGESSKDVGAGDLDAFAETLGGFLDAVGAARAHLVGHSMGGAVAMAYALDHPDRVASLTLVAAAGLGEDINPDYIDGFVAAERRRELKGVLELLFADQGLVSRKLVDDVLRYKRLDGVDAALRQIAGAMYPSGRQTAVLTGQLDRLQAPALVVWGAQDRVLPAAHGQALAARARVEVLAGAGHSPHMEAANEVNRLVGGFLDELEGEPR